MASAILSYKYIVCLSDNTSCNDQSKDSKIV